MDPLVSACSSDDAAPKPHSIVRSSTSSALSTTLPPLPSPVSTDARLDRLVDDQRQVDHDLLQGLGLVVLIISHDVAASQLGSTLPRQVPQTRLNTTEEPELIRGQSGF